MAFPPASRPTCGPGTSSCRAVKQVQARPPAPPTARRWTASSHRLKSLAVRVRVDTVASRTEREVPDEREHQDRTRVLRTRSTTTVHAAVGLAEQGRRQRAVQVRRRRGLRTRGPGRSPTSRATSPASSGHRCRLSRQAVQAMNFGNAASLGRVRGDRPGGGRGRLPRLAVPAGELPRARHRTSGYLPGDRRGRRSSTRPRRGVRALQRGDRGLRRRSRATIKKRSSASRWRVWRRQRPGARSRSSAYLNERVERRRVRSPRIGDADDRGAGRPAVSPAAPTSSSTEGPMMVAATPSASAAAQPVPKPATRPRRQRSLQQRRIRAAAVHLRRRRAVRVVLPLARARSVSCYSFTDYTRSGQPPLRRMGDNYAKLADDSEVLQRPDRRTLLYTALAVPCALRRRRSASPCC